MRSITYQELDDNWATEADRINYWLEIGLLWLAVILAIVLWR